MSESHDLRISDGWILSQRGRKNPNDPLRPVSWLVEEERTASGSVESVAVIFLTNRECPYYCLMCDLWKNTTDFPVPAGSIPSQIEWALEHMPLCRHVKLYNSGSFFDEQAIHPGDYARIASSLVPSP